MTNDEFSNEFDVLYNNITSNQAPGLDEYEKSVFLTKAQNLVVLSYFNPRENKVQLGYDNSERRQIDFSMITKSVTFNNLGLNTKFSKATFDLRDNSVSVNIIQPGSLLENEPLKILLIINELVVVTRGTKENEILTVVPISYDLYQRLMSKPYKRPLKFLAWRIFNNSEGTLKADIIVGPNDTITKYSIRYLKRPNPIILDNLEGNLTIDGISTKTECELDEILHHDILQRAVELAKAAYIGDLNSLVALGLTSLTEVGFVTQSK